MLELVVPSYHHSRAAEACDSVRKNAQACESSQDLFLSRIPHDNYHSRASALRKMLPLPGQNLRDELLTICGEIDVGSGLLETQSDFPVT